MKGSRCSCHSTKDKRKTEEKRNSDTLSDHKVSISEINFENVELLSEKPNDNQCEPAKEESPDKTSESNGKEQEQERGPPENESESGNKNDANNGNEAKYEEDTKTMNAENGLGVMVEGRPITTDEAKVLYRFFPLLFSQKLVLKLYDRFL